VTDERRDHDRDAMIATPRDGKRRAPTPPESDGAAERAARRDVEMAAIRVAAAPHISGGDFIAAKRAEVESLEAFASKILEANPRGEDETKEEEAHWRELARTARQMRPLLEALERAEATEPGFEPYRAGFDFRLVEAMSRVSKLCSFLRVQTLRQRKTARKPRPNAESPFTEAIARHLRRNPDATAKDIETALVNDAHAGGSGGEFELSRDKLTILTTDKPIRRLKISGIPSAVTKVRDKLSKKIICR
jgi:hypothetical protein